mgnify:CR=1 FL=1
MTTKEIFSDYQSPKVEMMEIELERGFATSNGGTPGDYEDGGEYTF